MLMLSFCYPFAIKHSNKNIKKVSLLMRERVCWAVAVTETTEEIKPVKNSNDGLLCDRSCDIIMLLCYAKVVHWALNKLPI